MSEAFLRSANTHLEFTDGSTECLDAYPEVWPVSATELHALPLPPITKVKEIEKLISSSDDKKPENISALVERIIEKAYGTGGLK